MLLDFVANKPLALVPLLNFIPVSQGLLPPAYPPGSPSPICCGLGPLPICFHFLVTSGFRKLSPPSPNVPSVSLFTALEILVRCIVAGWCRQVEGGRHHSPKLVGGGGGQLAVAGSVPLWWP